MRPKKFLFSFIEDSYIVNDGRLYPIFNVGGRIKVVEGEKISRLESYFFRGYTQSKRHKLVSFVKNVVVDLNEWQNVTDVDCLSKILPNPCVMIKGKIYSLMLAKGKGSLYIKKKGWMNKGDLVGDLYGLAHHYEASLERMYGDNLFKPYDYELESLAGKVEHYWDEHDVGFMRSGYDFYLTTRVPPYVLYEKANGKYFRFGEAVIGVKVNFHGNMMIYEKPCVINNYTHPALPSVNKSFQTICNGDFRYRSLKKGKTDGYFFRAMLLKARSLLTKGYFGSSGAWKDLTSPVFQNLEIPEHRCSEVANL